MPLHLLIVHFPIVLLTVGAGADLLGVLLRSPSLRRAAGWLVVLGAAATLFAFLTGGAALSYLLLSQPPGDPRVEAHARWATVTLWVVVVAGAARALWREHLAGTRGWANLFLAITAALFVAAATVTGTAIRHL